MPRPHGDRLGPCRIIEQVVFLFFPSNKYIDRNRRWWCWVSKPECEWTQWTETFYNTMQRLHCISANGWHSKISVEKYMLYKWSLKNAVLSKFKRKTEKMQGYSGRHGSEEIKRPRSDTIEQTYYSYFLLFSKLFCPNQSVLGCAMYETHSKCFW